MRSDKLTAVVALAPAVVAKGDTVRLRLDPASILGYVSWGSWSGSSRGSSFPDEIRSGSSGPSSSG